MLHSLSFYVWSKMYLFTNVSKPSEADKALIYGSGQLDIFIPLAHGEALPAHQLLAS